MNPNTGELIGQVDSESHHEFMERLKELGAVPLTDEQYEETKDMMPEQRKGYMRNQACPCGSGRKFKKCCW